MDDGFNFEYAAPEATIQRPPHRPFRWLKRLAIGVAILAVVLLIGATAVRYALLLPARKRTADILARLDQSDPGWRLDQIEAARKVIPEAENSATPIMAAFRLLPKDWPTVRAGTPARDRGLPLPKSEERTVDNLIELGLVFRPDDAQAAILRAELEALKPALSQARKAADLLRGRYPIVWALNPIETLLPHTQNSRNIVRLLKLDAILRAHDGDIDGAVASCRAMLNVARSLGDEPLVITLIVRLLEKVVALRTLELVLSSGEASDEALAAIQRVLEAEEAESLLRPAIRGERAVLNEWYARLVSGEIEIVEGRVPAPMQWLWGEWMCTYAQGESVVELTRAVTIDDGPISGLRDRCRAWERGVVASVKEGILQKFSRLMLPAFSSALDSYVMSKARLRSTIVAVAAERYRREHGHWPESEDDLTPWPLARIPVDPCTDEPLLWAIEAESIAIYSTGPDLADDDASLEQDDLPDGHPKPPQGQSYWQGKDFGFRLHDAASRHK